MPTGYTASVQDGTVTEFADFAMQCARQFGALIMMRDEPANASIPERFERSTHHDKELQAALEGLFELEAMSLPQLHETALQAHGDFVRAWSKRQQGRAHTRIRYEAMLAKVQAWTPPTPDHAELKTFMECQLSQSIDFDCGAEYDVEPRLLSADAWKAERQKKLQWEVDYHTKGLQDEIDRTESRNKWVADLRASLASDGRAA